MFLINILSRNTPIPSSPTSPLSPGVPHADDKLARVLVTLERLTKGDCFIYTNRDNENLGKLSLLMLWDKVCKLVTLLFHTSLHTFSSILMSPIEILYYSHNLSLLIYVYIVIRLLRRAFQYLCLSMSR